jgi:hypothetical protein
LSTVIVSSVTIHNSTFRRSEHSLFQSKDYRDKKESKENEQKYNNQKKAAQQRQGQGQGNGISILLPLFTKGKKRSRHNP